MQSKGRVVSREKLMERLWETDSFVDENTLTVNIGRLRGKKLDAAGLPGFITTRWAWAIWWGEGYADRISAAAAQTALAFFLFGGIFAAAFALYQLPARAVAYPLCAVRRSRGGLCWPWTIAGSCGIPAAGAAWRQMPEG